jgi:hypothetical protein
MSQTNGSLAPKEILMKRLLSIGLLFAIFGLAGVLSRPTFAQTEEEFQQEFQTYFETHDSSEWEAYALGRLAGMTTQAYIEERAWSLLESSFTSAPCLSVKQQLCDSEYEQKLLEITALTAAAATACILASSAGPIVSAACFATVALQHAARLSAASRAHRACYLRARLECFPVSPPACTNAPSKSVDKGVSHKLTLLAPECDWSDDCDCQERSPIVIDVAGNGFDLTDLGNGVRFDITGSLGPEPLSWTRANSDDAFLALDLNANGAIDNGQELLGNFSAQQAPAAGEERNGFKALEVYDTNLDGIISVEDGVYSELRLWQDRNHNGVSEPEELHPLRQLGLKSLELKYERSKKVDRFGNEFRYRAKVRDEKGTQSGRWAWDVFLLSALRQKPIWERLRWPEK